MIYNHQQLLHIIILCSDLIFFMSYALQTTSGPVILSSESKINKCIQQT